MGLFGGGNSTQTTNTTDYSAALNPQLDLQGIGETGLVISPQIVGDGGAIGDINTTANSYYAPVSFTNAGPGTSSQDLQTLATIQQSQLNATVPANSSTVTAPGSSSALASILSGNNIYWLLGAVVVLLFAHHKT